MDFSELTILMGDDSHDFKKALENNMTIVDLLYYKGAIYYRPDAFSSLKKIIQKYFKSTISDELRNPPKEQFILQPENI